jgi:hypothetical protein
MTHLNPGTGQQDGGQADQEDGGLCGNPLGVQGLLGRPPHGIVGGGEG